jgi:hypothetical protein
MAKPIRPEPKVFLTDSFTGDADSYDAFLFPDNPSVLVRGEKSTSYLDNEDALRRIDKTFPDAKYLVALRDPVERALSHYRFSVENGLEKRTLEDAIKGDLEGREPEGDPGTSVSPYAYVRRGRYLEQLLRLESHVPRRRLCVLISEEMGHLEETVSSIYRFVGIDDGFLPQIDESPINASVAEIELSPRVRGALREHFASLNDDLAAFLGRSLDSWQ